MDRTTNQLRLFAAYGLALLACLLSACSTHSAAPDTELTVQVGPNQLSPFPAPAALRYLDSLPTERFLDGVSFDHSLPSQSVSSVGVPGSGWGPLYAGGGYQPQASGGQLGDYAYAIYRFNNPSLAGSLSRGRVSFSSSQNSHAGRVHMGLANFAANRWDWYSPDANGWIDFSSWKPYLHPVSGEALVAVLLAPGEEALLQYVLLGGPMAPRLQHFESSLSSDSYYRRAPNLVQFTAAAAMPGNEPGWYDFDFNSDGAWEVLDGTDGTAEFTYNTPGDYSCTLRVRGADGQFLEDTLDLNITPTVSAPPLASLLLTPDNGSAPLTVTADASGSMDDRSIIQYEFDLNGDGFYETQTGSLPSSGVTFVTKGSHTVGLRVTDDYYQTAETTASAVLNSGWVLVDTGADSGSPVALAGAVAGAAGSQRPGFAFCSGSGISYKQASDAVGTDWSSPAVPIGAGTDCDLIALADGRPAVAYSYMAPESSQTTLSFAAAADTAGSSFPGPVLVSQVNGFQHSPALCLVNDLPVIAVGQSTAPEYLAAVRYFEAGDASGTVWSLSPAEIAQVGQPPLELLCIGSGAAARPLLALAWTEPGLQASVATLSGLPQSWARVTGYDMQYLSPLALVMASARPALLFNSGQDSSVQMARALDADGSSWPAAGSAIPLLSPLDGVQSLALLSLGGRLHVAAAGLYGSVWYCRSQDAAGTGWETPQQLVKEADMAYANVQLLDSGGELLLLFARRDSPGAQHSIFCAHFEP